MKATLSEIEKYLRILSETPQQIAHYSKGLEEARLQFKSDQKSWSANDILAHLRSCADLWTHSIYAMLAENEPVFSDINERKWAKVTRYDESPFFESLQAFSLQRRNLLHVLKVLPLVSWERSAFIFERKYTVFIQTRRMAKHEQEHVEQIASLLRGKEE
jgi:DinB family protein